VRRDNPEAHKLWFFTRKGVRTHEEPNLMGFFFGADCLMVVDAQTDAQFN
jgi:hypothetical protein